MQSCRKNPPQKDIALSTTPIISNVEVTNVAGNADTPWSVATITASTVTNPTTGYSANVEDVLFELTPTGSSTYAGAIQADYLVGSSGTLTPIDNVFYQADGASTAVYYGSEAVDPFLLAAGVTPSDAGYAYTVYNYASDGALTTVVAVGTNGQSYTGT